MKPREIGSGVNGKPVYLNSRGYLPERKQDNESHDFRPAIADSGGPGTAAGQPFAAGNVTTARTNSSPPRKFDELIYSFEAAARKKYFTSLEKAEPQTP